MSNTASKTRKPQSSPANLSPRITNRVKLSLLQTWVNELSEMGFSTSDIALYYSGIKSHKARVSHIAHGAHMAAKPEIRVTEDEFRQIQAVYFIAVKMSDKFEPLKQIALSFHGDMAKAQSTAAELIQVCMSAKGGK